VTIFLSEADAARLGIDGAKKRRSAKHAREARPDIPRAGRAAAGEGERIKALGVLAKAGWVRTNYLHSTGEFWMTHRDGQQSARFSSYRSMIDGVLAAENCK
jgi:hypothetical protein